MGSEQEGSESEENLVDLGKQIEDYENDQSEFDDFINELDILNV